MERFWHYYFVKSTASGMKFCFNIINSIINFTMKMLNCSDIKWGWILVVELKGKYNGRYILRMNTYKIVSKIPMQIENELNLWKLIFFIILVGTKKMASSWRLILFSKFKLFELEVHISWLVMLNKIQKQNMMSYHLFLLICKKI